MWLGKLALVIPATAGIHGEYETWIPTFAEKAARLEKAFA